MVINWNIPVIVFHHVSPDINYYTNTPPPVFEKYVIWLAKGFKSWTLEQAYKAFLRKDDPKRHVIITFDDGYIDNFTFAKPVLDKYAIKATFFVLPRYIGRQNTWNKSCGYRQEHMSLKQLKTLVNEGHEIGSHGLTHLSLTQMSMKEAEKELAISKRILRISLDTEVNSFAYPYGIYNDDICRIAMKYYNVSFSSVKSFETNWMSNTHGLRRVFLPMDATRNILLNIINREIIYDGSGIIKR